MFFKKEYKVIGRRTVGTDPLSHKAIYVNEYKATMVPVWSRIMMVVATIVIMIGGAFATIIMSSDDTATAINIPTTTTVEETTTTVEITTTTVEEITVIPSTPAVEYVCDTYTNSTEYAIQHATFQDGSEYDIDWSVMADKHIVFQWNMDNTYLEDFKADVAMFAQYTHMDVTVQDASYTPAAEDYLVPVVMGDLRDGAWAQMNTRLSSSGFIGMTTIEIVDATFTMDPDVFGDQWATTHTHTVLHELGHMVGLDHTHDAEGQQTDSIMSYESDYESTGYLPGDIAGLKEVFCN
jgi:hypothetical protein